MDMETINFLKISMSISFLGIVNGIETRDFTELVTCDGMVMKSSFVESSFQSKSLLDCSRKCSLRDSCKSFQFGSGDGTCQLNSEHDDGDCTKMQTNNNMKYYDKIESATCDNGGVVQPDSSCNCVNGYVGTTCDRLMTDCSEGFLSGFGYPDGVYNLQPPSSSTSFPASCEMKSGGRTYIHMRFNLDNAPVYFNRSWAEYRDGFGSITGDHWLGLEKIFHICSTGAYSLKIEFRFRDGSYKQQYYDDFRLTDETDGFRLSFSSTRGKSGAPIGDCLTPLVGKQFSTYDRDNDNSAGNCAEQFESGFWFDACSDCNPNGRLLAPLDEQRTNVSYEVFWTPDLGNVVPYELRMWLVRM